MAARCAASPAAPRLLPLAHAAGYPFEVPSTLGEQWAYDPTATYKSARQVGAHTLDGGASVLTPRYRHDPMPQVVQQLIPIISKGGNWLLNIGLDSTGVWAPAAVTTLQNLSSWMAYAAESIHNTTVSFPYQYTPNDGQGFTLCFTTSLIAPSTTFLYVLPNAAEAAVRRIMRRGGRSLPTFGGVVTTEALMGRTSTAAPSPFAGMVTVPHFKPAMLASMPTSLTLLTPTGDVPLPYNTTTFGVQFSASQLFPPVALPLTTYYRNYTATGGPANHVDNAPCGMRDCSVYANDQYTTRGVEGFCYSTPTLPGGEASVPVLLFYNGVLDNLGAAVPPSDGQAWDLVDTECYAYAANGTSRWPLEVWRNAALSDYWTLASPASRAAAIATGYSLAAQVGFVDAAPPTALVQGEAAAAAAVQSYAAVIRVIWA